MAVFIERKPEDANAPPVEGFISERIGLSDMQDFIKILQSDFDKAYFAKQVYKIAVAHDRIHRKGYIYRDFKYNNVLARKVNLGLDRVDRKLWIHNC